MNELFRLQDLPITMLTSNRVNEEINAVLLAFLVADFGYAEAPQV